MPDVIPGSDISVPVGPAIGGATPPVSIANGDRLVINAGIDINTDAGDAVEATFAALEVDVDGSIFGDDGGVFLNDTTGTAVFTYVLTIGATGSVSAASGQGIFAGSVLAENPVNGSLVSVNNAGLVSTLGFEAIRFQTADNASLINTALFPASLTRHSA